MLTGFMGTGKTSVGRELAAQLGMEFVDTDDVIESRHGPIERIFADQGEATFRDLERQLARELGDREGLVVATGGGMMIDPANIERLGRNGLVFCLRATPEEIHRRVTNDELRKERPLLNVEDLRGQIAQLMAEREPGYRQFRQVDTGGRTVDSIVDEIIGAWKEGAADHTDDSS